MPSMRRSFEVDAIPTGADRDYSVAHDCCNVVNPLLVERQISRRAWQGIGRRLARPIALTMPGRLLSFGFADDYALRSPARCRR